MVSDRIMTLYARTFMIGASGNCNQEGTFMSALKELHQLAVERSRSPKSLGGENVIGSHQSNNTPNHGCVNNDERRR
jgi:hypothetical protein